MTSLTRVESNGDFTSSALTVQMGDLQGRTVVVRKDDTPFYEKALDVAATPFTGVYSRANNILATPLVGEGVTWLASKLAYRVGVTLTMRCSTQIAWFLMANVAPALFVGPLAPIGTAIGTCGPQVAWLLYGMELRNHIETWGGIACAGVFTLPQLLRRLSEFFAGYVATEEGKLKVALAKVVEGLKAEGMEEKALEEMAKQFNALTIQEQKDFLARAPS